MTPRIAHTTPASTSELLSVLALFPKCMTCGRQMSVADRLEPDPHHAFRLRHAEPCSNAPPSFA